MSTVAQWVGAAAPTMTRDELRARFAGLTRADVAFALLLAETPDEVDAAAHLSLALFEVAGCAEQFAEHGTSWLSLSELVGKVRQKVCGPTHHQRRTAELLDAYSQQGRDSRARDRHEAYKAKAQLEPVVYRPVHPASS